MKKKLAIVLASVLIAQAGLPFISKGVSAEETAQPKLAIRSSELNEMEYQLESNEVALETLKDEANGIGFMGIIDQAIAAIDKLKTDLLFNTVSIYKVETIGTRLEAATEVVEAITFSIRELDNKVSQAHEDLGFAITKLVIRLADPYATADRIVSQMEALEATKAEVLTYPDLQADDRATVYAKKVLDDAIWETRFQRDEKILAEKPFEVYNALNQAITQAVGVQLDPTATVAEVQQAIVDLEEALALALE